MADEDDLFRPLSAKKMPTHWTAGGSVAKSEKIAKAADDRAIMARIKNRLKYAKQTKDPSDPGEP